MIKRIMLFIFSGILMMNLCGCFAIFAGVAGGAGTAVWLSGKLTQEFHASHRATLDATKSALETLNIPIIKETDEQDRTQIKATYTDGQQIWIDIYRVADNSTKVEIRVGFVSSDKKTAGFILKKIQSFL